MTATLPLRPCAGILLFNSRGEVFTGRRLGAADHAWQWPQGGIDEGETPREAALRELEEETGIPPARAEIVAEAPEWLEYELPADLVGKAWKGRWRGQRQKWFAMRYLGTDAQIDIQTAHPEFDAWRWMALEEVPALVVPFKRPVYERLAAIFAPLAADIRAGRR